LYKISKRYQDLSLQGTKVSSVENILLGCLDSEEKKKKIKDYFMKNDKSMR
jgi:hypothetical protein